MMYVKVIELILADKKFKEVPSDAGFAFQSDEFRAQMIMTRGVHCKEVRFYAMADMTRPIMVVKKLDKLKDAFYMGSFHLNQNRGIE